MTEPKRMRRVISVMVLLAGAVSIALGAIGSTVSHAVFDSRAFANRAAASLEDPRVANLVADRVTTTIIEQSPDLTAIRPLILVTVRGLVALEPMRALVRTAARSAHNAFFAEGTRRIVLAVPDVGILVQAAFQRMSPEVAEKIPIGLQAAITSVEEGPVSRVMIDLGQFKDELSRLVGFLLVFGVLALGAGVWLDPNRRRGLVRASLGLLGGGLAVLTLLALGGSLAAGMAQGPLRAEAIKGLWDIFLSDLRSWGLFLTGLGLVMTAAGLSFFEGFRPVDLARRSLAWASMVPSTRLGRLGVAIGLVALGALAIAQPAWLLRLVVVVGGLATALVGMRELFRLALETAMPVQTAAGQAEVRRTVLLVPVVVMLLVAGGGMWLLHHDPAVVPLATAIPACNGHPALCSRTVDRVVFPGAHNAMSNARIADWMFPHHQGDIPDQLRDGVKAFLIDVHYGFPGAARIKTDLSAHKTMEVLESAVGPEGVAAAERIRETLVGVDEGRRGLYLCHGFCELGAYEVTPTLAQMRSYLVQHPSEVLILVVEDYITPEDLAQAFEDSGLADYVYDGPSGPPWPTLHDLVRSRSNVIVFLESGTPGVPWLRPAFTSIQETPYTFHQPEEFTCRANRGGTDGTLFQINHWIETTPAPRPSNAEIVNARETLLARAQQCRGERGMLPNIIAVDFYRSGDLFLVVRELNGLPGQE